MARKVKSLASKPRKDTQKLFVRAALIATAIWIAAGGLSFLDISGLGFVLISLVCSIAPCALLLFAVVAQMERKRTETTSNRQSQLMEHMFMGVTLALATLAEIVHLAGEPVSFAMPVTLFGICFLLIGYITRHKFQKGTKEFKFKDVMTVFILGSVGCVCIARFLEQLVRFFAA